MGTKIYNNEQNHSKLIKDLKELPKITSPENFEYNLMTRIHNKNFGEVKNDRAKFNFVKFLAPSAIVVTALILFFLFLPQNHQQIENPLMTDPVVISENAQVSLPPAIEQNKLKKEKNITDKNNNVVPRISEEYAGNNLDAMINPNDVVVKPSGKYPINRNRSVSLDDYISGESANRASMRQGNIVNSGERSSDFDGFFVRQEPDQRTIEKYRAMMDSVKKAQIKADSIKKAQK